MFTEKDLKQKFTIHTERRLVTMQHIERNDESKEHRLTREAMELIGKCNEFMFSLLPLNHTQDDDNQNIRNKCYYLVPLKQNYNGFSLDIDFESIVRICEGAKSEHNGVEWKRMFRSNIKEELVQCLTKSKKNKNRLYVSYGISKHRYTFPKGDDEANDDRKKDDDVQSVYSFVSSRIANGFDEMGIPMRGKAYDCGRVVLLGLADLKIHVGSYLMF